MSRLTRVACSLFKCDVRILLSNQPTFSRHSLSKFYSGASFNISYFSGNTNSFAFFRLFWLRNRTKIIICQTQFINTKIINILPHFYLNVVTFLIKFFNQILFPNTNQLCWQPFSLPQSPVFAITQASAGSRVWSSTAFCFLRVVFSDGGGGDS